MFRTTRALVLRETKYKEADKILTILTEDEGKMTVSARRVMRRGSRIAAACQLLVFSEMTLFENRGRWTVEEAQTVEQFLGLRADISLLALGTYVAELLEAVSDEDSPNPEVLRLGLNTLYALAGSFYPPEHIKAVFEMRLMCLSGYEPQLESCPVCGKTEMLLPALSTLGGTVLCSRCAGNGFGETTPLDEAALAALRHIAGAESKRIFSFTLEQAAAKKLYAAAEAYVQAQLERRFPALDFWKSVR